VQSDKEERVHRAAVIPGADPHARGRSLYYHYAAPAPFEKVVAFYEDHLSQRLGLSAADRPKLGEVTNEAEWWRAPGGLRVRRLGGLRRRRAEVGEHARSHDCGSRKGAQLHGFRPTDTGRQSHARLAHL